MQDLPEELLFRLDRLASAGGYDTLVSNFGSPRTPCFRINNLAAKSTADPVDRLLSDGFTPERLSWPEGAWMVPPSQRDALTRHALVTSGAIYIQNASSQAAVWLLDPQPGEEILDLAAAPGGKTLAIAERTGPASRIAAVESSKPRYYKLKGNLARCGAPFVHVYHADGRTIGKKVPERFDAILLDAPCSAESLIQKGNPETWAHWNFKRVRRSAALQRALLESAWLALKPGGRILYATCTLAPEENEVMLSDFLAHHAGDAFTLPLPVPTPPGALPLRQWDGKHLRIPHASRILPGNIFAPFFYCLLRKRAS
jgi:16S rRNA C967 or C1407 C5-methylase (RsmB/RsmF family)